MQTAALKATTTAQTDPGALAKRTNVSPEEKTAGACQQFEAILLRQILSEAFKPVASKSLGAAAAGMYQDMTVGQLADSISQSGTFGLARSFEVQMRPAAASPPPHHPAKS